MTTEDLPPELPAFDGTPAELPPAPAGVLREPTSCRALLTTAPPLPRRACESRDSALEMLADALGTDPEQAAREKLVQKSKLGGAIVDWPELMQIDRYRREYFELVANFSARQKRELHALERCRGFPPGFVRTVRAELERDCAETLATPVLRRPPPGISAELVHTLRGLALASRLLRAVPPSPVMPEPVAAEHIDAFVAGPITRYLEVTKARLRQFSPALDSLPAQSHGRAVALAGRAAAWQRIRRLRSQTIPDTLRKTYSLRVQYFERIDALGQGLEEQALFFTSEATASASLQGLLRDQALQQHLSQIHAPSKLVRLQLPRSSAEQHAASPWYRIASRLPARYPAELLTAAELGDENTLAELAPGGLSLRQKRALSRAATQSDLRLLAELHLKLALVLHRDEELREASRLVELVAEPTDADRLIQAVTRDLLRASGHLETLTAAAPGFAPSALLRLADDPQKPAELRAIADYDTAVLMTFSKQIVTLNQAYRRLQTVKETVSDQVTRDCADAFQYEIGASWRFKPLAHCRNWPWQAD